MITYLVRRTLLAVFTILVISFMSYMVVQLPPGDTLDAFLNITITGHTAGEAPIGRTAEQIALLRESWGLNRPIIVIMTVISTKKNNLVKSQQISTNKKE